MARSFEADPLALPRLDAEGLVALIQTLLAVAAAHKPLPEAVERARVRLESQHRQLKDALRDRVGTAAGAAMADSQRTRRADASEDSAFAALYDFLSGWSRLPDSFPESAQAQRAQQALFPDGLKFTQLAYRLEWTEAQARLERLRSEGLDALIRGLGGGPILRFLYAAHAEYGESLGLTSPLVSQPALSGLREPREAAAAALRSYILRITTEREDGDAATQAQCEALLLPLRDLATETQGRGSGSL